MSGKKSRKIKISLSDRTEEIFKHIPPDYAEIIINSVIAKSVQTGLLINEASLFLNSQDLNQLSVSLNTLKKVKKTTPTINKKSKALDAKPSKKEISEQENLDVFTL